MKSAFPRKKTFVHPPPSIKQSISLTFQVSFLPLVDILKSCNLFYTAIISPNVI